MRVTVYGASDDLIEIEGDLTEEFYISGDGLTTLLFGDGSVLDVRYSDEGIWRITQRIAGRGVFEKEEAPADDESNYSDRVTLSEAQLGWVAAAEGLTLHRIGKP